MRLLFLSLLALGLLSACSDDNTVTPPKTTLDSGTGGSAGSDAGDAAASCGTDETCVPFAPGDWLGPFAVWTGAAGDDPPSCPSALPTEELTAQAEPVGADACKCNCTTSGLGCPDTVTIQGYPDLACSSTTCTPFTVGTSCVDLSNNCGTIAAAQIDPVQPTGSCASGSVGLAEPKWNKQVRACSGGICEGGACIAADVDFAKTCIFKSGDEQCPSGTTFTERELYYQGADDTRACSETTCPCSLDGTCGYVDLFSDTACSVPITGASASLSLSACYANVKSGHFATANALACVPSAAAGKPSGSLTPTGPVTVCCQAQ